MEGKEVSMEGFLAAKCGHAGFLGDQRFWLADRRVVMNFLTCHYLTFY